MVGSTTRRQMAALASVIVLGVGFWVAQDVWNRQPHVVGVVNHAAVTDPSLEGFKYGMRELGYIEGRDIRYIYDGPTGSVETVKAQAEESLKQGADLLLALTTPSSQAAMAVAAPTRTPVIFAPSANPVQSGLVESMKRPGGYVTGVTFGLQEDTRLEWFVRLVPGMKKLMYPYNPADESPSATLKILQQKAPSLGVEIVPFETPTEESLRDLMRHIPDNISGIFISPDAIVASQTQLISAAAADKGIPTTTPQKGGVSEGALMSYGFNLFDLGRQAAVMADQVFNGADPATLPVQVADFKLTINIRIARQLRINIPQDILDQAQLVGG